MVGGVNSEQVNTAVDRHGLSLSLYLSLFLSSCGPPHCICGVSLRESRLGGHGHGAAEEAEEVGCYPRRQSRALAARSAGNQYGGERLPGVAQHSPRPASPGTPSLPLLSPSQQTSGRGWCLMVSLFNSPHPHCMCVYVCVCVCVCPGESSGVEATQCMV